MSRRTPFAAVVVLAIALLAASVQAQNVLSVRAESLDELLADIDTLAVAFGQQEGSSEGMLAMVQGALGLPGLDWVDRKNPIVLALPLEGVMLGQQGFVAAFPVSDVGAATEAMKSSIEGVEVDEEGMIHIPMGAEGQEALLMPADGYMIFGSNPSLVGGFDPKGLLAGANLPPGTLAAEFNVDSMRAMIGMGLQGARQQIGTMLAATAEQSGETVDPEAAAAAANMIVDWIESLVANTRSIQLSFEVSGSHVVLHNHYLPVSGSTLQTFLSAQKGGMPDIARLLDGGDASMVLVSNMTWTDEAFAALGDLMEGYMTVLQSTMMDNEELGPLAGVMPAMMEQYRAIWQCQRGDMAQVLDVSGGMRFVQVSGLQASDACKEMNKMTGESLAALPEEVREVFSLSDNAWTHDGIPVITMGMDFGALLETQMAEMKATLDEGGAGAEETLAEVDAMLEGLFGEDGFEMHMAGVDDVWVATGGQGSEVAMKTTIDRIKSGKRGSGVDPEVFAPFDVGAGLYGMLDFGRLVAGIGEQVPEDKSGEIAEVQEVFNALGAITGAVEFQRDALALKVAIPTAGLSTIARIAQQSAAGMTGAAQQGD